MLTLPDGSCLSVRMSASLTDNRFDASHMLVLGDLECVLLVAVSDVHLLLPVASPPPGFSSSKLLLSGVATFWAAHIPASSGAAAEVGFELRMFRTSLSPLVVIARGVARTIFVVAGKASTSAVRVSRMPAFRGEVDDRRFAGAVGTVAPRFDPDPMRARPLPVRRR